MSSSKALTIQDLSFRHRQHDAEQGAWSIHVDAFELEAGEQCLLVGDSGSGKSTLLNLVAGLIDPTDGRIHVAGQRIDTMHGARRDIFRGRHVGMIFQAFHLLQGFTALENVMLARTCAQLQDREARRDATSLLEQLDLHQPDAYPDQLSIGQQQRVAVARALACQPTLVLADEPTASLDPTNTTRAIECIRNACSTHGAALLATSHDPSIRGMFDRVVDIHDVARITDPVPVENASQ